MPFRLLYDELLNYNGDALFAQVLNPWLEQYAYAVENLDTLKQLQGTPIPAATDDNLWDLYAASRALELLVLRFQKGGADGSDWPGPLISQDEFVEFSRRVGFEVNYPDRFSPFYHEIVALSPSTDVDQPFRVLNYHWPCLMLGPLLFMRAGVSVSAGVQVADPSVASTSKLYWAHRRKNRLCHDLSYGWGSNSSWRTAFRRDYLLDGIYYFNVDGEVDLSTLSAGAAGDERLSLAERVELVTHRCFVHSTKNSDDLFPYDDRYSMPVCKA